jgi:uncharacterized membrane protein YfcA
MPDLELTDPFTISLVAIAALVGGFVRGFSGFGGPAVMILALVPFFAPVSILSKVMVIDLISNFKLLPSSFRQIHRASAIPVLVGTALGGPFGFYILNTIDPQVMKRVIAAIAGSLTVLLIIGMKLHRMPPFWVHAGLGIFAGVVLGATNIAFAAALYFLALPFVAAQGRANMILWGFFTSATLIVAHIAVGNLTWDGIWRSALLGPVYLAGAWMGALVFAKTSERNFRRLVLWFLLALSIVALGI